MLANRIARGVGWMFSGRILSNVLGLLSTLVVAYLLSPDDLGIFALATSVVMLSAAMLELPTSMVLIQMDSPEKPDFDTVFTINFIRGVLLSLSVVALAWLMPIWFHDSRLKPMLLVLALYPLIQSLRNPYFEMYAREIRFAQSTVMDVMTKLGGFVGTVVHALIDPSFWALVTGHLMSAIAAIIVSYVYTHSRPGFSLASWRRVFHFSIWLGFGGMLTQGQKEFERLILGLAMGTGILGLFTLASRISNQIFEGISGPITWVFYSGFSEISEDRERLKTGYLRAQAAAAACILPVVLGVYLVAQNLVGVLFDARWVSAGFIIQLIMLSLLFKTIAGPFWPVAMALAETRLIFFRQLWGTLVRAAMALAGLAVGGLLGFMIGLIIAEVCSTVISLFLVKRLVRLNISTQLLNVSRPLIAVAIMTSVVSIGSHLLADAMHPIVMLTAQVICGVTVYAAATTALWLSAGSPDGHEQLMAKAMSKVSRRLKLA